MQACPEGKDLCESEDELYPDSKIYEALKSKDVHSEAFFNNVFNSSFCEAPEDVDIALKNTFDL